MKMEIPFSKACIDEKEINAVGKVMRSGWLSQGKEVEVFEKNFADYIGAEHAVAVNSCTSALFLSLSGLGIKAGDEVITSPLTFAATANVIEHLGAKPVFVDVDEYYCLDPEKVSKKITKKTKAIIPVHFAGNPCEMRWLVEEIGDIPIIEDAAHALGTEYSKVPIGSVGTACFSFYPTKNITTGEGGMIATDDEEAAKFYKMARLHGISKDAWKRYSKEGKWKYDVEFAGYKCNMTDVNAAIGNVQISKLNKMHRRREEIFNAYNEALWRELSFDIPMVRPNCKHSYHIYTLEVDRNRNKFIDELAKLGVATSVHFTPLTEMGFYRRKYGYSESTCPIASNIGRRIFSLPMYPDMTDKQVEYVIESVKKVVRKV